MFEDFRDHLSTIAPLSDAEWNIFSEILQPCSYLKNDVILRHGQICSGTYFILEGAMRVYHLRDGKEIHTAFCFENDFARDIESLSQGVPAQCAIVALEDTNTLFIPKKDMIDLYDQVPSFQHLGRKILELVAISEQRYAGLFTKYRPKERYSYILEHEPHLVQRVPLQYLASYLGVARETLSRIRKKRG